ncbi:MAG: VanZ family protein [Ruminococcus sp.]
MKNKKVTICLLILYLLALVWIVLFKVQFSFRNLPHIRNINLIPFGASTVINGKTDYDEIIANFLVFIPYGLFAGILLEKRSLFSKIAPVFFTSLAFESIQFIFAIGASDITDLIMNTLGGLAGIGCFSCFHLFLKDNTVRILNIICLTGAVLLFAFTGVILLFNM